VPALVKREGTVLVSEYQYYEFIAIDRPLTPTQMAELRARSSRATITPTSFINEYHWGDLKGDPAAWMRRYFDAFVYVANWCSCRLALRVPLDTFDRGTLQPYASEYALTLDASPSHWIINWELSEGENYDRFGMEDGRGWMGRLAPLRDELLRGDLRPLYLGWLAGVAAGEIPDDETEPLLPPGLSSLTAAQTALVEFLEIDPDLLAAAAAGSDLARDQEGDGNTAREWIAALPEGECRATLRLLLEGRAREAERTLKTRFLAWQRERSPPQTAVVGRRTVAELRTLAEDAGRIRREREAKARAQAKARQRQQREAYLATLAADFDRAWAAAHEMAERGTASGYDETLRAIVDLGEAYALRKEGEAFEQALRRFMIRHGKRGALVRRLTGAKLWRKA